MHTQQLGNGIFTIQNYLSTDECRAYISMSESQGYEIATINSQRGQAVVEEVRNNDRVILDSYNIAEALYDKAKAHLPEKMSDGWEITGFNERLRFYRYQGEQYFKWHRDGSYARSLYEESYLTYIVYLNDDFDEGYTEFEKTKIYPEAGTALVFPHMLLHNAVPSRNGTKYVLRTDVMYSLKEKLAPI